MDFRDSECQGLLIWQSLNTYHAGEIIRASPSTIEGRHGVLSCPIHQSAASIALQREDQRVPGIFRLATHSQFLLK